MPLSESVERSLITTVASTEAGRTLFGYAAVFGVQAEINSWEGTFFESFKNGAFTKTLREKMPVCQFDHGMDSRVGAVPIGAFTMITQDAIGLSVVSDLFDNDVVEPVRQAIEAKAITGMSIRFQVVRDVWKDNKGKIVKGSELLDLLYQPGERGPLHRTITEVKLSEAGPVVFPAYATTSVGVRAGLLGVSSAEVQAHRARAVPQRLHFIR